MKSDHSNYTIGASWVIYAIDKELDLQRLTIWQWSRSIGNFAIPRRLLLWIFQDEKSSPKALGTRLLWTTLGMANFSSHKPVVHTPTWNHGIDIAGHSSAASTATVIDCLLMPPLDPWAVWSRQCDRRRRARVVYRCVGPTFGPLIYLAGVYSLLPYRSFSPSHV